MFVTRALFPSISARDCSARIIEITTQLGIKPLMRDLGMLSCYDSW